MAMSAPRWIGMPMRRCLRQVRGLAPKLIPGLMPCGAVVNHLPPHMALPPEGATEALAALSLTTPPAWAWSYASDEEDALLQRYLPQKRPQHRAWHCVVAPSRAAIGWRSRPRTPAAMLAAYRASSISHGRTAEATEQRIETITHYAQAVQDGAEFPPLLLYFDGRILVMLDGARRLVAHLLVERTAIKAVVATRLR